MAIGKSAPPSRIASFRLSAEAHARITEQAAGAGVSTRAWLESAILTNQTRIVARVQQHPDLKALIFQVNKAGNTLSRIAHRLHALNLADGLPAGSYDETMRQLSEIEALMSDSLTHARAR